MNSEPFRDLTRVSGPFVSVYFNDSRDTADAESQLEARWRGIHRQLERLDAPETAVDLVREVVLHGEPAVGRRGRAVIATSEGWHGYGQFQHTTEDAVRMNLGAVCDRLTDPGLSAPAG